jgi:hypothetical protein
MSAKDLQNKIIGNEGYILSDGTLNLQHLLPKAYDLINMYELKEDTDLNQEILDCFELRVWDKQHFLNKELSLFIEQYHSDAELIEDKQEEASELWNETIFNFFNKIAPDGYSFGSSEGDGACIGWFKCENYEEPEEKQVIASWVIANTASLNVWDMKSDEAMFVGINDDEPEWFEIEYRFDEENIDDGHVAGIDFHGTFYRLDHCMRAR